MKKIPHENLERKIKRNIYGKLQTLKVTFPPGMSQVALDETQYILAHPWFEAKSLHQISLDTRAIRIDNIHLFSATELLMRNQCLTDIRLVIFEGKAAGRAAFAKKCRDIAWGYYLNDKMSLKIKVNSVASRAFHESGLRDILSDILAGHLSNIVRGEETEPTTVMYVDLHQDKLSISISLAGSPLYKRGYRGVLSASAPLREDIAAGSLQKCLQFAKNIQHAFQPNTIIVPFSGTGTFLFEYLSAYFQIAPVLFQREFALQKMPLFRPENFNFLLNKAREHCLLPSPANSSEAILANTAVSAKDGIGIVSALKSVYPYTDRCHPWHRFATTTIPIPSLVETAVANAIQLFGLRPGNESPGSVKGEQLPLDKPPLLLCPRQAAGNKFQCYCIDNSSEANRALQENLQLFKNAVTQSGFMFSTVREFFYHENFLQMDIASLTPTGKFGDVFLPLNPPYGIRLGKKQDSIILYRRIAHKVNEIAKLVKNEQKHLAGFILCPTEETWTAFCRGLTHTKKETYHLTQGGLDVRICQFYF